MSTLAGLLFTILLSIIYARNQYIGFIIMDHIIVNNIKLFRLCHLKKNAFFQRSVTLIGQRFYNTKFELSNKEFNFEIFNLNV